MKIGKMVVPYEMANVRFHDGCHVAYPRCEGLRCTLGGESVAGFDEDFAYDPIGNRISATDYDETDAARTSTYAANNLNQYTARTVPGWASVRGLAAADATVAVNGNPAYMVGRAAPSAPNPTDDLA